jgi:hypothetical protein
MENNAKPTSYNVNGESNVLFWRINCCLNKVLLTVKQIAIGGLTNLVKYFRQKTH